MKKQSLSLIIGRGEVGKSLEEVLSSKYRTVILDKGEEYTGGVPVFALHITFGFSRSFMKQVQDYQKKYQPKFTIIHSTVPVGTSARLMAFHSPIRGVHPMLAKSIRTFETYLAPFSAEVYKYLSHCGMKVEQVLKPETTEALKLWCTTQYGMNIIMEKLIHEFCEENGVNFDLVYTRSNHTYNEGYTKLGMKNVVRPVLKHQEGGIGGHCVIPNLDLFKSPINDFIKKHNRRFAGASVRKVRKGSRKNRSRSKGGN